MAAATICCGWTRGVVLGPWGWALLFAWGGCWGGALHPHGQKWVCPAGRDGMGWAKGGGVASSSREGSRGPGVFPEVRG